MTEREYGKIGDMNAIQFYGGNSNTKDQTVPEAKSSLVNLFNVPAAMYMTVPPEYFDNVIQLLKKLGYAYKTVNQQKWTVFALQYQKVE